MSDSLGAGSVHTYITVLVVCLSDVDDAAAGASQHGMTERKRCGLGTTEWPMALFVQTGLCHLGIGNGMTIDRRNASVNSTEVRWVYRKTRGGGGCHSSCLQLLLREMVQHRLVAHVRRRMMGHGRWLTGGHQLMRSQRYHRLWGNNNMIGRVRIG